MQILGYLVTDRKMKNIESFVEQVSDISLADSTKPILIVSWKNAKKHPNYKTILDKQLDKDLFWTFSKAENRSDFEVDLENFYKYIFNNISKRITYCYVNVIKLKYTQLKKLYNIVFSNRQKNIYINNRMVYIPFNDKIVLGVSLQILSYCKIKQPKVLTKIFNNRNNIQVNTKDKDIIKLSNKLGDNKYVIPLII